MILVTTTVENIDRFLDVFGTKGADKRALYGSKGSTVFRDQAGWAKFVSDPELAPILRTAGIVGKLEAAPLLGFYRA